ncbi:MAG: AAA family ATPase [Flavobacterium sp.]|nr:AAA family ATPase [Pedobacter sp.]
MDSFSIPFKLATDYINRTNRAVFLTGKAGTGKTTFLKQIKQQTHKQVAVVAPTGVAAINAGGSTIHSFFQLPFNPYLPEKGNAQIINSIAGKSELISRVKMTISRRKILQELELLIIDEISMVRCDTMDAIDVILRHFRYRSNEPFGGVQLLLIGDMYQLSPVARQFEWQELSQFYKSPYFFHSRVMMQQPPVYIELDKIYRQKNEDFIRVLNEVRNNNLSAEGYGLLQKRYNPDFSPDKDENYITLCTHNYLAEQINAKNLATEPGKSVFYTAQINGEYPENNYPLEKNLELKIGAKVMFIKNDLEKEKRYYNGKIGVIKEMDKELIKVKCQNETELINVGLYVWENIKYEVDKNTQLLNENIIGTFQQFPLRLAWAITIHKSQGLTFEKAIIDAGKAFASGQVYVALSRCVSLDGLVLKSQINSGSLNNDQHIVRHSNEKSAIEETQNNLISEKALFKKQLLNQLFDFSGCLSQLQNLTFYFEKYNEAFDVKTSLFLLEIKEQLDALQLTSKKFQVQLSNLHDDANESNEFLQDRISAGSGYFKTKIEEVISRINQTPVITDSKIHSQQFNNDLKDLFIILAQKSNLIEGIQIEFSIDNFYKARRSFIVPPFSVNVYAGTKSWSYTQTENTQPELLQMLRNLRNEICEAKNLPVYMVASSATLLELTEFLPLNISDISKISGFGKLKTQAYGQRFLELITAFCKENGLESKINQKLVERDRQEKKHPEKINKTNTKLESFIHYKNGKTIDEIAGIRKLTSGTILGHLSHFLITGEIKLTELVSAEKINVIEAALITYNNENGLAYLKQQLGNQVSYADVRIVAMMYKASKKLSDIS